MPTLVISSTPAIRAAKAPAVLAVDKELRPYEFHGLTFKRKGDHGIGDCPFCGKEGKFSVSVKTGQWRCYVCAEGTVKGGGNAYTFLRALWRESRRRPVGSGLVTDRKLLSEESLDRWGVGRSPITGDVLVPGHNAEGKLCQLYKYALNVKEGRMMLWPTPGLGHQLFVAADDAGRLGKDERKVVYLCEGVWDAIALWEVLCRTAKTEAGYKAAASESLSLARTGIVLGVPSASTFSDKWVELFRNKRVVLCYDSDRPKVRGGRNVEPAGLAAAKRASRMLAGVAHSVRWIAWGEDGHDPLLKDGADVRDWLTDGAETVKDRVDLLSTLMAKVEPVPEQWLAEAEAAGEPSRPSIEPLDCRAWRDLVNSWRIAFKWTEGLDRALSVMLASVVSTKSLGDQLWIKIVGPAACGKSTLCEALAVARKHVVAKSTIRGFHSGFKSDRAGEEDNSLIIQLYDKTLLIKDGDTLLQSPNLPQILSEGRDIYDTVSRTHYRNKMGKDYQGLRMTIILCGTSSLRQLDSSELGERFVDCVIMESIDDELEDEILSRVAVRADEVMNYESDGQISTHYEPKMLQAMQLTGGYVNHLREHAKDLIAAVHCDDPARAWCVKLGKLVALLRARPSVRQEETAERELATRLVSQMVRLAKCLAVVLNRNRIDKEVLRRVTRCATDTARGRTMELVKLLREAGKRGCSTNALSIITSQSPDAERKLLRFLKKIDVVEFYTVKGQHPRWRLTERMESLWDAIMGNSEKE